MRACSDAHEAIIYDEDSRRCPLCVANDSLAEALAEVSRLEGRVKELGRENAMLDQLLAAEYRRGD